jgi:hypothetical protein
MTLRGPALRAVRAFSLMWERKQVPKVMSTDLGDKANKRKLKQNPFRFASEPPVVRAVSPIPTGERRG